MFVRLTVVIVSQYIYSACFLNTHSHLNAGVRNLEGARTVLRKEKAYAGGRKLTVPEAAGAELGLLDSWQGQRAGRMGEVRGSGS